MDGFCRVVFDEFGLDFYNTDRLIDGARGGFCGWLEIREGSSLIFDVKRKLNIGGSGLVGGFGMLAEDFHLLLRDLRKDDGDSDDPKRGAEILFDGLKGQFMVTESSLMNSAVALITPTARPMAPEAAFVVLVVAGVATKSHPKNPIWLAFYSRRYVKVVLWPSRPIP